MHAYIRSVKGSVQVSPARDPTSPIDLHTILHHLSFTAPRFEHQSIKAVDSKRTGRRRRGRGRRMQRRGTGGRVWSVPGSPACSALCGWGWSGGWGRGQPIDLDEVVCVCACRSHVDLDRSNAFRRSGNGHSLLDWCIIGGRRPAHEIVRRVAFGAVSMDLAAGTYG